MNDYERALTFYTKAQKSRYEMNYFVENAENSFWHQFIYRKKFNPFVKSDKFFYYCDRPHLNMVLLYKRTEQWNLARKIFRKMLENYSECEKNGKIEMFVKVLNYQDEIWDINDFISKNRSFLGGKTLATWLNNRHKDYVYLCYQEILEGEIELGFSSNMECFRGIGEVYAMKQEYSMAIDWLKKVIDIDINAKNISTIDSITIQLYQEILSIYNEKLNDPLSIIAYMKEI
jgi:tetratricopeptide (TPR) repeat protein